MSSVATTDLYMRTNGPEVAVGYYSGTAVAAGGHADEARQDSITEMGCYKSCSLEDPSTKVDYQDRLGHNVQSSYSKLGEKVMGLYGPACDGSNEDRYRYLKRIQQMTLKKNYQHNFDE